MSELIVSIGIVTWNSADFLPACLSALRRQAPVSIELIVVDNASVDSSLEIVRKNFPNAEVIRNTYNAGFCHAHNQAIEASKGNYYLALNPDVELQEGYISSLVQTLEKLKGYGSAAGKLLLKTPDESVSRIDSTGLFIDRRRRQYLRGHGDLDRGQYDQPGEVFGVDGAAPLYRREMLEDIKIDGQYFDESFFAHKEDVDVAWRARLFGWRCWYQPDATAYHWRSFKPGNRDGVPSDVRVEAVKNRYLLLIKNETGIDWKRDWIHILWYDLQILTYICLFERSSLRSFIELRHMWSRAWSWRREIGKRIRVRPGEIPAWFK